MPTSLHQLRSTDNIHSVVFYSNASFLIRSTVSFLLDGLIRGDGIVIVTTKTYLSKMESQLRSMAAELGINIGNEQISTLDANHALSMFMDNHKINVKKFYAFLLPKMEQLCAHYPGVTAYGDMVNVLCKQKNFWAAMKLEKLWCEIAERYPLNLHCGYFFKNFNHKNDSIELAEICQQHTTFETQPNIFVPKDTNVLNKIITSEQQFELDKQLQSVIFELKLFSNEAATLRKEIFILKKKNIELDNELQSIINLLRETKLEFYNLFNRINIPILYLDNQLQIYRYNDQFKEIVDLIPNDIGRKFFDFNLYIDTFDRFKTAIAETLTDTKARALKARHINGKTYLICILSKKQSRTFPNGIILLFIEAAV